MDNYAWAAQRCAARECCASDLRTKLLSRGASDDEAAAIIDRLTAENYLDEARYARAFVNDKLRFDHWGKRKIQYALRMKGVADGVIDEALGEVDEEEYTQILADFLHSRLRSTKETDARKLIQKVARSAAARGFEMPQVFDLLHREVSEEDED